MTRPPQNDNSKTGPAARAAQGRLLYIRPRASLSHQLNTRYSRWIHLLKLALPLTAAALVVVLIAWPRFVHYEPGFMLSVEDLGGEAQSLRMENLRFTGADTNGNPFVITASAASQQNPEDKRLFFEAIEADFTLPEGAWYSVSASAGSFNRESKRLTLSGRVNIYSDTGYEINTRAATIDLAASNATSDEEVRGQGPLGTLSANGFSLDLNEKLIRFGNGVRMTLIPRKEKG